MCLYITQTKQADRILAIGVFDLFHIGHLRFLQYAKAQGRHLSVAVWTDAISQTYKKKLPVIPQEQRLGARQGSCRLIHAANC